MTATLTLFVLNSVESWLVHACAILHEGFICVLRALLGSILQLSTLKTSYLTLWWKNKGAYNAL